MSGRSVDRSTGTRNGEEVKLILAKTVCVFALILFSAVTASTQQLPNEYTEYFDSTSTFNGAPILAGSIVDAFSEDGALCGSFTVFDPGHYGFMPVYGDDPGIPYDGAASGDSISFEINGRPATIVSGDPTWDGNPAAEPKQVKLDVPALEVTVSIEAVEFPSDTAVQPGEVHKVWVKVRNNGNGLDFYGLTVSNSQPDFGEVIPSTVVYADSGAVASLWFYIEVPSFTTIPDDTVSTVSFSVFSKLDPTKSVAGTFDVAMYVEGGLDATDGSGGLLPDRFAVDQNYPNPFNPSTSISFNLPTASSVTFEVFDILGRSVDLRDLGFRSSGQHVVEYDASALASGVYFYRIQTEYAAEAKKMILLK